VPAYCWQMRCGQRVVAAAARSLENGHALKIV
jgi:hypothetical protein